MIELSLGRVVIVCQIEGNDWLCSLRAGRLDFDAGQKDVGNVGSSQTARL